MFDKIEYKRGLIDNGTEDGRNVDMKFLHENSFNWINASHVDMHYMQIVRIININSLIVLIEKVYNYLIIPLVNIMINTLISMDLPIQRDIPEN